MHDPKVEIGNFKAGLHSTSQHIQEPKRLKEAVKALSWSAQHLTTHTRTQTTQGGCKGSVQEIPQGS